jgi:hypothetical protein
MASEVMKQEVSTNHPGEFDERTRWAATWFVKCTVLVQLLCFVMSLFLPQLPFIIRPQGLSFHMHNGCRTEAGT